MMYRSTSLTLLLIILSFSGFSQEFNTKKLNRFFDSLAVNQKTMGSFAIAKNGRVVFTRSVGYSRADQLKKRLAVLNTCYDIGSVSKMFTATMVFQLIDEHKLSLSTTLYEYFPDVPNAKAITIDHLLAHESGLYDVTNDNEDSGWITVPHSRKEILEKIIKGKIHFLPGSQSLYNNSGYILLGYILERITGQTYNENLQRRICSRINLKNTYSPLTNHLKKNEAAPYTFLRGWQKIKDIYSPNDTGADNILSTPSDLIVFNEALLSGKLISKGSQAAMLTFKEGNVGRGIYKSQFYQYTAYGHDGDTYGIHSTVQSSPDDKLSIAYCINGEVYPHNDIAIAMLKIWYGAPYSIPSFKDFKVQKKDVKAYSGLYYNKEAGLTITITRHGTILIAEQSGVQLKMRLYAVNNRKFEIPGKAITMEFDAPSRQFVLTQEGKEFIFEKVQKH
jgi:D-alanyl-D-alanine carboxypeptidase